MHASIRVHHLEESVTSEVLSWVNDSFAEDLSSLPGFVAYYGVNAGDGDLVFVSIFRSEAAAEESNRRAMMWLEEHWSEAVSGMSEEFTGPVRVSRLSEESGVEELRELRRA